MIFGVCFHSLFKICMFLNIAVDIFNATSNTISKYFFRLHLVPIIIINSIFIFLLNLNDDSLKFFDPILNRRIFLFFFLLRWLLVMVIFVKSIYQLIYVIVFALYESFSFFFFFKLLLYNEWMHTANAWYLFFLYRGEIAHQIDESINFHLYLWLCS